MPALGQAEVQHLHDAIGRDLDVRGFQIAMDDAPLVCRVERVSDLAGDGQRFMERKAAAAIERRLREAVGERRTLDQLQHQAAQPLPFFDAVNRRDIRMVDRREELRLAFEPSQPLAVARSPSGRTLIATSRARRASCARYTSPIPPAPMASRIS